MSEMTHNGRTMTTREWSRETGISVSCLESRKLYGWSDEKSLTTPPQKKTPRQTARAEIDRIKAERGARRKAIEKAVNWALQHYPDCEIDAMKARLLDELMRRVKPDA